MMVLRDFGCDFSQRNCLSGFLASRLAVCQTNMLSPTSPLPMSPTYAPSILPAIQA